MKHPYSVVTQPSLPRPQLTLAGYRTASVRLCRRVILDTVLPPLLAERTLPPPSDGVDSPGAARRPRPEESALDSREGREVAAELSRLGG